MCWIYSNKLRQHSKMWRKYIVYSVQLSGTIVDFIWLRKSRTFVLLVERNQSAQNNYLVHLLDQVMSSGSTPSSWVKCNMIYLFHLFKSCCIYSTRLFETTWHNLVTQIQQIIFWLSGWFDSTVVRFVEGSHSV